MQNFIYASLYKIIQMRNFTFIIILSFSTFFATAQSEASKNILQSFSTTDIHTVIVKVEGNIEFKTWQHPKVCVQTSLIPVSAKYRAVEILAETGDYDVLSANGRGKMLIYDNPNAEYVYFKGERQTMDIQYIIYVPEGVRVIDVFRNDLLAYGK